MASPRTMGILAGLVAWVGLALPAGAQLPAEADDARETLVIRASPVPSPCEGLSAREARQLAKEAQRREDFRRAAECYRVAGDAVRADRAMLQASADRREETSRNAEASAKIAEEQLKQLRAAFR